MDACEAEARQDVLRLLNDAAGERRNGLDTTDVGMLTEHLVEALARASEVEQVASEEEKRYEREIDELEAQAACRYTADERKAGKSCEECAACRLSEAKREIDCGATDEQREAGACQSADDLGIDRCGKCAAQRAEKRVEEECADRDAEIARLTRERDDAREASPSKAADTISQLRSDLALAKARHDCGREDRETSDDPCPLVATPQGCCDECFVKAALAGIGRGEAEKRTALEETIAGLRNDLSIVTEERDAAVIRAGVVRAVPAKKARRAVAVRPAGEAGSGARGQVKARWPQGQEVPDRGEAMSDHDRCNERIRELEDQAQASAARAIDEAKRYAADRDAWAHELAAEKRAGAVRVERIRVAILDGASGEEQADAIEVALDVVEHPDRWCMGAREMAPAYLAQCEVLREARAELARLREVAREMAT